MSGVLRLQHTSVPMPTGGHEAARRFYGDVLGMSEIQPPKSLAVDELVWFRAGEEGHEVHVFTEPGLDQRGGEQHLCLQVDDLAFYRDRLAAGSVAIREATEIVNRPRLFIHDPFGNLIELTEIQGPYA